MTSGRWRRWAPWLLVAAMVGVGLGIGVGRSGAPPTLDQQVRSIASEVRCPSCADLNAAESNAVTAVAVRNAIRQRLQQGQSRAQIESFLAGRYGADILLRPPTSGAGALVWALPVLGALVLLAAGGWALHRWTGGSDPGRVPRCGAETPEGAPDAEDEAIVRRALESFP